MTQLSNYLIQYSGVNFFADPLTVFTHNVSSSVFLSLGKEISHNLSLDIQLSGSRLEVGYDKYGDVWTWETFKSANAIDPDLAQFWLDVMSQGSYPKKWRGEGVGERVIRRSPLVHQLIDFSWTVSTDNWSYSISSNFNDDTSLTFEQIRNLDFTLKATPSGQDLFTVGTNNDTPVTIQASANFLSFIDPTYPHINKTYYVTATSNSSMSITLTSVVFQYPDTILFTISPFIEVGQNCRVFNNVLYPERLDRVIYDFDDGVVYDIKDIQKTGLSSVPGYFDVVYSNAGVKNVVVTVFVAQGLSAEPYIKHFDEFIFAMDEYDNVNLSIYNLQASSFDIPHEQIYIYPNEICTSKTFNTTLLKLQDNIDYLKQKSLYFDDSNFKLIGWYGISDTDTSTKRILSDHDGDRILSEEYHFINWEIKNRSTFVDDTTQLSSYNTLGSYPFVGLDLVNDVVVDVLKPSQLSYDVSCIEYSRWHLYVPSLSDYINIIPQYTSDSECIINDMFTTDDFIFTATPTQLRVQRQNIKGTLAAPSVISITENIPFSYITSIVQGPDNNIYICDRGNSALLGLSFKPEKIQNWEQRFLFTGIGNANTPYRFSNPNDLCLDLASHLYVCDSGNRCIKIFTSKGEWIHTLKLTVTPISITVDSQNYLHILTYTNILVYECSTFTYRFTYTFNNDRRPFKIRANYNKEIIYVCSDSEVIKHFRTGNLCSVLPINQLSIRNVYQDKYRNLYVIKNDIILKYTDRMVVSDKLYNTLIKYWSKLDISIDKDEFVQDWVYTRAFQRMWDNIERFRAGLSYRYGDVCNNVSLPKYSKDEVYVAQNEIVTSSVLNRCITYLHDNLKPLYKYFNGDCIQK